MCTACNIPSGFSRCLIFGMQALQGLNRAELTKLIIDVLKIQAYANKKMKGGRRYVALSKNIKDALAKNKYLLLSFLLL